MANLNTNVLFEQLPSIVTNHPETKPDHWAIMVCLYKILKDKPICIYSSETLSINCHMTLRTTERRLAELIKMGFIECLGRGYNRRIKLGLLFNNPAISYETKLNNPAKNKVPTAKKDICNRHTGGDTKISSKISSNEKLSLSTEDLQEKNWYINNPHVPVKENHMHLFEANKQ